MFFFQVRASPPHPQSEAPRASPKGSSAKPLVILP